MSFSEKLKKFISPILVRYTVVGTAATAVNYAAYWFFSVLFSVNQTQNWLAQIGTVWAANHLAWFISTGVAYLGNRLFVFRDKSGGFRLFRQIVSFFFWRWLSCAGETLLLNLMVTGVGLEDKRAKIVAIIFSTVINYFTTRYITFHQRKKPQK